MPAFKTRKGQTLVIALLLMVIAAILVPIMVKRGQNESKWTMKQARTTTAYHLAEAGQDRAIWYLVQAQTNWMTALSGTPITNYNGDTQYSDVAGGLYNIKITSGPLAYQVTVLTKGRDTSTNEVRAIRGVYSGAALLSGMVAQGTFNYENTFTVYWGQVVSYTSINQTAGSPPYHPVKVSKGAVVPWDSNPTAPNADTTKNYTAYSQSLTVPPQVDFDYYRAKAKATRAPNPATVLCGKSAGSNGGQTAGWVGTGYFDGTGEAKFSNYIFDCSTCVFFFESGKVKTDKCGASKDYLNLEALIVYTQNIHIHANGANPYTVNVPTDAWKQYTAGTPVNPYTPDTAALDQYPGDGGLNVVRPTYTIPNATFDGTGTGMAFRGFLYTYKFDCGGGINSQVGQMQVGPGGTDVTTMYIYFDPTIAANVRYVKSQISRESWDEIKTTWP